MVHTLERLQNQGDDKAGKFLASIMRFQFIIALVIAEHILHRAVYLSTFLPDTDYDILEAIKESKTVIEMLRAESVQDELHQSALSLAKFFDICDSMPRRGGRQITRANHPAETPKQYWRISLYYPLLDNLITSLKHVSLNRKTASMHSIYCPVLQTNQLMIMLLQYTRHIRLTFICHQRISGEKQPDGEPTGSLLNDLPTTLKSSSPSFYIYTIVCVLLTMPVASTTVERSFSILRCLKNYVRSTMKNDRRSSLGLVHIHRDFEVDLYKAMGVFVSAKTRRADFGQF